MLFHAFSAVHWVLSEIARFLVPDFYLIRKPESASGSGSLIGVTRGVSRFGGQKYTVKYCENPGLYNLTKTIQPTCTMHTLLWNASIVWHSL